MVYATNRRPTVNSRRFKITLDWLRGNRACIDGMLWFSKSFYNGEATPEQVQYELHRDAFYGQLPRSTSISWANWLRNMLELDPEYNGD